MHREAIRIRDNPGWYNLYNHNCNQVAQTILSAGGKDFTPNAFNWQGTIPNLVKTAVNENIRSTWYTYALNYIKYKTVIPNTIANIAADGFEDYFAEYNIAKYLKDILNVKILNENNNYVGWMVGKVGDFQYRNGCITKR